MGAHARFCPHARRYLVPISALLESIFRPRVLPAILPTAQRARLVRQHPKPPPSHTKKRHGPVATHLLFVGLAAWKLFPHHQRSTASSLAVTRHWIRFIISSAIPKVMQPGFRSRGAWQKSAGEGRLPRSGALALLARNFPAHGALPAARLAGLTPCRHMGPAASILATLTPCRQRTSRAPTP
jgi:hypothetical protein